MWWLERHAAMLKPARLVGALALAAMLGGCFEPLYGERSLAGGPGLKARMAAVDVFDTEPLPARHPLRTLPNVVATPHIGYVAEALYRTFYRDVVANIEAWLETAGRKYGGAD